MPDWLRSLVPDGWSEWHIALAATSFAVASAVVSLFVAGYVLGRLPEDFFVNDAARVTRVRHPVLRVLWIGLRNVLGWCLVALGVVLSLPGVPGQGILTILMGVVLVDFPGKYGVERWIVSRSFVSAAINKLRAKLGRPPLIVIQSAPRI
jgi:hypothetical protein